MKVIQLHEWTPKQFLSLTFKPKIVHHGPKKSKTKSELKDTLKIKVFNLYE